MERSERLDAAAPVDPRFPRNSNGPPIRPAAIAKAAAEGFDISRVWYHGSAKRIGKFRKGTADRELGPGIYLADSWEHAWSWSWSDGYVMSCYIREGEMFDLTMFDAPKVMRDLYQRHIAYMRQRWGDDSPESMSDFKKRLQSIRRSGEIVNRWLKQLGFVGAYDHTSQIIGQVVVFDSADVRVVAATSGDEYRSTVPVRED